MDHSDDVGIGTEDSIQVHKITAVDVRELRTTSYYRLNAFQYVHRRIGEIIHDSDIVALLHQFYRSMRTDIAGSACYKYSCHKNSVFSVLYSE